MSEVKSFTISLDELGISQERLEEELKIYCDCDEEQGDLTYTNGTTIEGVGFVGHHGWLCPKCHKYVQVG